MKPDYVAFSTIRDSKKMRDSDVVKRANVPQSTLSDWKSGRSCPKVDKLYRIAAALHVPIESLLREDGPC